MFRFTIILVLCVSAAFAASGLQCYICNDATKECEVSDASAISCGGQCTKRVKIGATDVQKAVRKCVMPDAKTKQVECPIGYNCENCEKDLCNSAPSLKFVQLGVIGAVFAVLYIN